MRFWIKWFVFVIVTSSATAQGDLSIHFMKEIIQSSYNNPAMIPQGLHIALPSAYLDFYHSGGSLNQFLSTQDGQSVLDLSNFTIDDPRKSYFLTAKAAIEPLTISYLGDRISFGISYQLQTNGLFIYDQGIPDVLVNGNAPYIGQELQLNSNLSASAQHVYAFSVGYHLPNFAMGGRLKYISGIANIFNESGEASILTQEDTYQIDLTTNYSFLKSGDVLNYIDNEFRVNTENVFSNFLSKNIGVATDLGIKLNLSDQFYVNASILDLGQIRWRDQPQRLTSSRTTSIRGADLSGFLEDQTLSFEALGDSLSSFLRLESNTEKYNNSLPTRILIGMQYDINDAYTIGLLYGKEYNNNSTFPTLAAQFTAHVGEVFHVGTVYSTKYNRFTNLGLHFLLELGPVQLFGVTDNIIDLIDYKPYHHAHIRGGINLKFVNQD